MTPAHDIDYLLEEVVTLPSLPGTVERIANMLSDPDCALSDVSKVMAMDPSISLKALRLVNSAYYGLRQKITSVDHAVSLLGIKVVKNLVLTAAVFDTLQSEIDMLLRHSIVCGMALRAVYDQHPRPELAESGDEAFIIGLLHDIGKVLFEQYLPEDFEKVRQASTGNYNQNSSELEQEIIGCDHAQLGAALAVKWQLAPALVDAIAGHHDPARCENRDNAPLAAMTGAANCIAHAVGVSAFPGAPPHVSPGTWELSGLASHDAVPIMTAVCDSLSTVEEFVKLAAGEE